MFGINHVARQACRQRIVPDLPCSRAAACGQGKRESRIRFAHNGYCGADQISWFAPFICRASTSRHCTHRPAASNSIIGNISGKASNRKWGIVVGVSGFRPCARQTEHCTIQACERLSRKNQSNVPVSSFIDVPQTPGGPGSRFTGEFDPGYPAAQSKSSVFVGLCHRKRMTDYIGSSSYAGHDSGSEQVRLISFAGLPWWRPVARPVADAAHPWLPCPSGR